MTFGLFTINSHYFASSATIYTLYSQSPLFVFLWDSENKPKNGGICVANHTSPIDVIILASDGCYAMVSVCMCVLTGTVFVVCEKEALKGLTVCVCVIGGTDPWGSDGSHSEIYGESLSTHLV